MHECGGGDERILNPRVGLVQMPTYIHTGFVGRCELFSREYVILKNSVIHHILLSMRYGSLVEILCSREEANLILDRAIQFYPTAAPTYARV